MIPGEESESDYDGLVSGLRKSIGLRLMRCGEEHIWISTTDITTQKSPGRSKQVQKAKVAHSLAYTLLDCVF